MSSNDSAALSIEQIKQANRDAGHHFFDASTMRFFNSTVYPRIYGGRYFITGERFDENHAEAFTIRVALDNGHVNTVGDFQCFDTHEEAEVALTDALGKDSTIEPLIRLTRTAAATT